MQAAVLPPTSWASVIATMTTSCWRAVATCFILTLANSWATRRCLATSNGEINNEECEKSVYTSLHMTDKPCIYRHHYELTFSSKIKKQWYVLLDLYKMFHSLCCLGTGLLLSLHLTWLMWLMGVISLQVAFMTLLTCAARRTTSSGNTLIYSSTCWAW